MNELTELYQELILDHNARPRNFGALKDASHRAEGINPLCGDQVVVYLQLAGDTIEAVRFDGKGCAISKASASLMTQALQHKTLAEAEAIFGHFHDMVTAPPDDDEDDDGEITAADDALAEARSEALGKLEALSGVRGFPMRIKCATLAWHTLNAALKRQEAPVSTEVEQDVTVPEDAHKLEPLP